jgi:hypothetical protein
MKLNVNHYFLFLAWLVFPQLAGAISPIPDEMAEARYFAATKFEGLKDTKPVEGSQVSFVNDLAFSFIYDGKSSSDILIS